MKSIECPRLTAIHTGGILGYKKFTQPKRSQEEGKGESGSTEEND
jgi:hypothetical protein